MFKDSSVGTTHAVCNQKLSDYGSNAKCCGCFPHEDCELKEKSI